MINSVLEADVAVVTGAVVQHCHLQVRRLTSTSSDDELASWDSGRYFGASGFNLGPNLCRLFSVHLH